MPLQLPPGIRIRYDPSHPNRGKRRSLTATRPFSPGDQLATFSNPLLALPDNATMRTTCNYCLRPSADTGTVSGGQQQLKACTGCKAAVYCNATCQRAHWRAVHKAECKMFARVREQAGKDWLPTPVRAVAQVLLMLRAGDAAVREAFEGGGDGEWSGLEGNVEGFKADGEVWKDFELQTAAAAVYARLLDGEEVLTKAREILCKIQTNAFNRLDADTGMGGIFLDAGLAMVNHSCVPNAFIGFDKRTAVLRAERPIQEGEEITISYIDNTLPKAARHEALRSYHFRCDCLRCEDDLDVYDVCQNSPDIPLNSFSLQPDLEKLRNPPIDRSKVSKVEIEAIYKKWQALAKPEGDDEGDHLKLAKARWKLCRPLIDARMWAVEPLPTTILELATRWQTSNKMVVYALPLLCCLATECDPFKLVAPFMPWRIKGIVAIVKLLAVTGELTASGALATRCTHEGLVGTLATSDQVSMCEALLRLVVRHASVGAAEDWDVLQQAKSMLEDVESLQGREQESNVLRAWAKDPNDPECAAFFENQVLKPIKTLSSIAVETLEAMLSGRA
ncbi:SET domain-containing protein [Parathielavia appendiculata]|uniref:SET domain-containing protein n=1 Tax=Parathielavia appendiculata TaxID=2587402 RepID=A0AAN6U623_9PEZI|nr:SET domain-containing protein [Parathielavia appendiculata]